MMTSKNTKTGSKIEDEHIESNIDHKFDSKKIGEEGSKHHLLFRMMTNPKSIHVPGDNNIIITNSMLEDKPQDNKTKVVSLLEPKKPDESKPGKSKLKSEDDETIQQFNSDKKRTKKKGKSSKSSKDDDQPCLCCPWISRLFKRKEKSKNLLKNKKNQDNKKI